MNSKYSLEIITAKRLEKKEELRISKEKIQNLTQELFSPPETKSKMDLIMHNINSGMAAYDGIMTGVKIYRRIREIFGRKKQGVSKK